MRVTSIHTLVLGIILLTGTVGLFACTVPVEPADTAAPTPPAEVTATATADTGTGITETVESETPTAEPAETGMGLNSVIFDAEQAEAIRSWAVPQATGTWTPTPEDIAGLEAQLVSFLQSAEDPRFGADPPIWERLGEYNVQYLGLEENGQRIIYANFFCALMANDNWVEEFYQFEDGGDCAFQVKYDVESATFYDLQVNGQA